MSGSNDPSLQLLIASMRRQQQPSTQSRLAQMMMQQNMQQAQTPVWGTGATLARAGSGVLAGLMAGMAERSDRAREDEMQQAAADRQEKQRYNWQQELAAGPPGQRQQPAQTAPQEPMGGSGTTAEMPATTVTAPDPMARLQWLATLAGRGNREAETLLAVEREAFNRAENQRVRQEDREFQARLARENRAPRAPEELIPTVGPDGNPVLTPRSRAVGMQPWRPPERVAVPPGYRPAENGLEPIPGGPADPSAAERLAAARRAAQPVPQFLQRAESDDLEIMGTASNINQMLGRYEQLMAAGQIPTTLVGRGTAFIQNNLGRSTPESQNLASFRADLERLRNESLRLNNGVQTEGDAQRAWNELIANMNDPAIVQRRLREIQGYNQQAIELRQNLIDQRRANYGLPPLETSRFRPPAPPAASASPSPGERPPLSSFGR